jgi:hypothetical protein
LMMRTMFVSFQKTMDSSGHPRPLISALVLFDIVPVPQ